MNSIFIIINQMGNCHQQENVVQGFNSCSTNKKIAHFSNKKDQNCLLNVKYCLFQTYYDKVLGKCFLVQDKLLKTKFLLKHIYLTSEEEYMAELEQFLKKKLFYYKQAQVFQIKDVIEYEIPRTKSNLYKLSYIMERPASSLKQIFSSRMVKKQQFSQTQIINLLLTSIIGYAIIQSTGSKNSKIRMDNISTFQQHSPQLSFKVIDDHLIIQATNFQVNKKFSFYSLQTETAYLSPQQFIAFVNQSNQIIVDQKSGVFSLGATVLSLCLMQPIKVIYNSVSKFIDSRLLNSLIYIATSRYGDFVGKLLSVMLQLNQEKRPKFGQLLEIMQKIQIINQIKNTQLVEFIESSVQNDIYVDQNKIVYRQTCFSQFSDQQFSISI